MKKNRKAHYSLLAVDAPPAAMAEVERQLLLANDLNGLTVRASLEASPKEVGGSVLVVRSERLARTAGGAKGFLLGGGVICRPETDALVRAA